MGALKLVVVLICLVSLLDTSSANDGSGLSLDFYKKSCPQLEKIVEDILAYYTAQDPTTPAPLLRLFFHDCFVQGCDASVLLNSTEKNTAEKDAPINFSVGNYFVVDHIKAVLEQQCPDIVSCADVLALLAVYSIKQAGGPLYHIELGRRDGLTSYAPSSQTFLPGFSLNVSGLLENFLYFGLDINDVVTLSGAHTIGQGHCSSVVNRIYPRVDQVYPGSYGQELLASCSGDGLLKKPPFDENVQFFNDPITPLIFDNQYFKNLEIGLGLFTSDFVLFADTRTQDLVKTFADDEAYFFVAFGEALKKLGRANVLTGTQGQVRKECWVTNSHNQDPAFDPISYAFVDQ